MHSGSETSTSTAYYPSDTANACQRRSRQVANDNSKRKQADSTSHKTSILVAGFTKDTAYKLVRVRQGSDGSIYLIMPSKGEHLYFSRHPTGELHFPFGSKERGKVVLSRQSFSEFKGIENCGSFAFTPLYLDSSTRLARVRKEQVILCVDLSQLRNAANIQFFLVERGRIDLLHRFVELGSQILTITMTEPWVVLVVRSLSFPK